MIKQKDYINSSDEELVSKIIETKNPQLFAYIYDRYAQKVYAKCLSFTKSTDEAQDITHDIFIQLYLKLKTFKGTAKFSTWLYSLTYNFCLNYIQRDKKKKKELFVNMTHENMAIEADIPDSEIYQMKEKNLKVALDKIDPDDKLILLMKYQDDFSIKDIKESLNIGESAVKMRLKRAKEKLIKVYNEH